MSQKVFKMNDYDWVVAKDIGEAIEYYKTLTGEEENIEEVRECDLEKEGQYTSFDDEKKIAELETEGIIESSVSDENGMNGFGSLLKRDGEWHIKVPFKDILQGNENEGPYITATTEW